MFGPEYARACGAGALEPLGIALPDKNYPGGAFRKDCSRLRTAGTLDRASLRRLQLGGQAFGVNMHCQHVASSDTWPLDACPAQAVSSHSIADMKAPHLRQRVH